MTNDIDAPDRPAQTSRSPAPTEQSERIRRPAWSDDDLRLLALVPDDPAAFQTLRDRGRSVSAIRGKLSETGLAPAPNLWTPQHKRFLRRNYGRMKAAAIATELGHSLNSVYQTAHRLGLTRTRVYGIWSDEQLDMLERHYPSMDIDELAKNLGKLPRQVYARAHARGLRRQRSGRGGKAEAQIAAAA